MEDSPPSISVLMCVCNEEAWVSQAIESILRQTYSDFELLITDDGSSDNTYDISQNYGSDARVRILRHSRGEGLAASLNEQICRSRGRYIARMDGDDVADPERFTKQISFLDTHPRVGLLGSCCREIDKDGNPVAIWQRPLTNNSLQRALLRYNPFIHSTVLLRHEVFSIAGLYDQSLRYAQDYELWLRVAKYYELANLPEPLVDLRVDWSKLAQKNKEARRFEFQILIRHFKNESYPKKYYIYLLRPFLLSIMPTAWMMKLKTIQRRLR
ncbi:glycosyltransferase family 2 protein [Thermodesulfobacteriota bacterium]